MKTFCLQTSSWSLLHYVITIVDQRFVAPGCIVDERTSKVHITYISLQWEKNDSYSLSQFITTCTGTVACAIAVMPYQTLGFSWILAMCQHHLNYAVYHTHFKAQIRVINVRIYDFKQTCGMNCIIYTSSPVRPPITISVVLKWLCVVSCKLA